MLWSAGEDSLEAVSGGKGQYKGVVSSSRQAACTLRRQMLVHRKRNRENNRNIARANTLCVCRYILVYTEDTQEKIANRTPTIHNTPCCLS